MRKIIYVLLLLISASSFAALKEEPQATPSKGANVFSQDKAIAVVTPTQSTFVIQLKSNPTTGYSWFLREYNDNLLTPVKHTFIAPKDKKLMGAPGMEEWTFKAKPAAFVVPQETTIRFVYTRPWEQSDNTTQMIFKVITRG